MVVVPAHRPRSQCGEVPKKGQSGVLKASERHSDGPSVGGTVADEAALNHQVENCNLFSFCLLEVPS